MPRIILLTISFNEELNIKYLFENIKDFVDDIYILDSYSTDQTIKIAQKYTKNIYFKKFENYYLQRKHLIDIVKNKITDLHNSWFLILDCDEYLSSELKDEIKDIIKSDNHDAYYFNRRFIWKNKWIKYGGYYPLKLLRLIRAENIGMDGRIINEHYICNTTKIELCKNDFYDHNRKLTKSWFKKHFKYAVFESQMYFDNMKKVKTSTRILWDRLPLILRPFFLFFYRIIYKLGFLDGFRGMQYHFFHSLIYRLLVDLLIFKKIINKCIKIF